MPNCLIILNLNSFILLEALRLNIPILGIGTNIDKLQSITYPLLLNQNSIYSIFLFLNFLNVMFNITGY
jgi:ribosomal protein S2